MDDLETRFTSDLVNTLLITDANGGSEAVFWEAMRVLQQRASRDVFEAAQALCLSECDLEQGIGCSILSQLGSPELPFGQQSFPLVVSVLIKTSDIDTLASAISALGWLGDLRGADFVLPYLNHEEWVVRYWVTQSLTSLAKDARCIDGLIHMTTDPAVEVRDWATFGLGTMINADTPAIRAALVARLEDEDLTVRGEALVGLAIRQDRRVIEPLLRDLEAGTYKHSSNDFARDALNELHDIEQYPQLAKWKSADA